MKVNQQPSPQLPLIEQNKIDRNQSNEKAQSRVSSKSGTHSGTQVEISPEAQMMLQASELAKSAPDMRRDKVNELRERIQSGQYKVPAEQIADRMVDDHLLNDFGKNNL